MKSSSESIMASKVASLEAGGRGSGSVEALLLSRFSRGFVDASEWGIVAGVMTLKVLCSSGSKASQVETAIAISGAR